ncbi:hypothetical protein [Elioraea rosea]|uniref:hypothetical protein n=1 Tax=Elioraea rosea TaxID=2492390 RepID=UPI001183FACF|nr:hypothetical protein [Elioraea rosea]
MQALPGFTAEATQYASRSAYRGTRRGSGSGLVVAQLRPIGFCMADCDFTETNPVSNAFCKIGCLEDPGGGGGVGPSEPTCKPACGPCIEGTRLCITADCETVERTCRAPRPRRSALL